MNMSPAQLVPTFFSPGLAVAGALAVSIPIVIHILSRRPRKPEPWGAMRFLLAAYRKHRMRTRLEQLILLVVRCLAVLVLGLALAGPMLSTAGALAGLGGGRLVVLVMDDSVTSGSTTGGSVRLHALRDAGSKLLQELKGGDRVAVITTARPARTALDPTADLNVARSRLAAHEPALAAADWPGALQLAAQILETDKAAARKYCVLFSDHSSGSTRLADEQQTETAKLLRRIAPVATVLTNEPFAASDNTQVASFEPEQKVVVAMAAGQTPAVNWAIKLRRLTSGEPAAQTDRIRLTVGGQPPQVQTVSWEPGQREAEVRLFTPLYESGLVAAEVEIEGAAAGDALQADNIRRALVHARPRLNVWVAGGDEPGESPFTPRQWIGIALAPVSDRLGWPLDVRMIEPSGVGTPGVQLAEADALIVLRPDQLTETGLIEIKNWAEAGGLVWFIAPSADTAPLWSQQVANAFSLPWSVGPQPVEHAPPLLLMNDHPARAELMRLRADLPDLLSPIEIHRRLVVDPTSVGATTDVLLMGRQGEPILISSPTATGRGRVMLLSLAINPTWSNLTTKPLFVPLVHDVIRSAVDNAQPLAQYQPGDQPVLTGQWKSVGRLTSPDGTDLLLAPYSAEPNAGTAPDSVQPIRPFQLPGVYRSATAALAVNIESDAADTRASDRDAWTALMNEAGTWRVVSLQDPWSALTTQADRTDYTGPLLWTLLALALIETALARVFSHAQAEPRVA